MQAILKLNTQLTASATGRKGEGFGMVDEAEWAGGYLSPKPKPYEVSGTVAKASKMRAVRCEPDVKTMIAITSEP